MSEKMSINRYGELEILQNEIRYSYSVTQSKVVDQQEAETLYKDVMSRVLQSNGYVVADRIEMVNDRVVFFFKVQGLKGYSHLRSIPFEKQLLYFKSLVHIVKQEIEVLLHPLNFLVDVKEEMVKTYMVEIEKIPIHQKKDKVEALRELVLIAMTNRTSILGKPEKADFFDQRDHVIAFAEDLLRCKEIEEIERALEAHVPVVEEPVERKVVITLPSLTFWKTWQMPFRRKERSHAEEQETRWPTFFSSRKKQVLLGTLVCSIGLNVFFVQKNVQPVMAANQEQKAVQSEITQVKEEKENVQKEKEKYEKEVKELVAQLKVAISENKKLSEQIQQGGQPK
ncbi:hypothetical protein NPM06_15410 [Bacillus cereus]|uniref:hypothetical protein n=1 Tax=Bacillus cereus TaxID=1396 RepID=UPI002111997A|nr:hypothetical protein [Bacillus cereus]